MADFSRLSAILRRLAQEITQKLPGWLLGRPATDFEAERHISELEDLAERLRLLIRDLQSQEHQLRFQQRNLHGSSHGDQDAARWALRHQLSSLEGMKNEAMGLARFVHDSLIRSGLNPMQAANEFHDLIENLEKTFSHAEIASAKRAGQHLQTVVAVAPPQSAAHTDALGMLDTAVPVLTFACLLLRWAAAKIKPGKTKSARA